MMMPTLWSFFGPENVLCSLDRDQDIAVLAEAVLPGRDLVQALAVVVPHRAGGVDGGDAAGAQALVNSWAVPVPGRC